MKGWISLFKGKSAAWLRIGSAAAVWGISSLALAQGQVVFGGDPGCQTFMPGTASNCTIQRPEGTRQFLFNVPRTVDPRNVRGVIIDLHGFTDTPQNERATSSFLQAATARGMVIAFPRGTGPQGQFSFNTIGLCCGFAQMNGIDDVGFLRTVARGLRQMARVGREGVVVTGLSNGGGMTNTLACDAADDFGAAVAVSGGLSGGGLEGDPAVIRRACQPAQPIDILAFNATADAVSPFDTGVLDILPAEESRQLFAQIQNCNANTVIADRIGNLTCEVNPGCAGGVLSGLCVEQGGNHILAPTVRGTTVAEEAFKLINQARAQRGQRGLLPEPLQ